MPEANEIFSKQPLCTMYRRFFFFGGGQGLGGREE
jgi:hypothetical protein